MLTIVTLALALITLAKKIKAERKGHAGDWKLTAQIASFDVVVGAIFTVTALVRLLQPSFSRVVSVPLVVALAVATTVALGVRTYALKRNGLPFDFKWDSMLLLPALLCLFILYDFAAALPGAGGH
ncbi:hypothetical protein WJ47_21345 [Burkholderia ubonensis]|uniref:Uncharacterized protein n=1 Tax=Burkholderia ubonensis TaxID=101571 RepID=A0AB73FU53_9BURK|nr:hypothetical protein [Burkholderia ubonensis]KVK83840.1 hypothetical protein WJ44_06145 [Burkholderia ubonensis]KVL82879.1 hypothetical protein WJ47_21345 [Burkholderia ubonensis]KVM23876.1 hypothetical protein WJ53_17185 [Burkholderia ubonensis]KVM35379.1 hypothetical protein WJ54_35555 [Burkholderia ubonensis]KVP38338.1 hypothetical protein WJ87_09315 [Burkholderia ubonensis]